VEAIKMGYPILPGHRARGVRIFSLLAVLLFSPLALAEGITLNQCANGGIADAVDHLECYEGWINGNLNKQKAAFAEGEFVPYRVVLSGLTVGSPYTYSFSWDTLKSGVHALDYIGTFNQDVINADPCQNLVASLCTGTNDAESVPADPDLALAVPPVVPIAGQLNLYGGTIDPIVAGDYFSPGTDVRAISVTFTPTQATVVLTWGGHISSPLDWGDGNTAADIKGSPYHVSNIALMNSDGETVASGGQDVQMSAGAVFVPSSINIAKTANRDGTFTFESYLDGIDLPPDPLLDPNPWTLQRDTMKSLQAMDDGEITVTETSLPVGDWRIKSIICSELGGGEIFSYVFGQDPVTDTAVFDVTEAGTYDCTFDNEFFGAPALDIIKKVIGPGDNCTEAVRDSSDFESRDIYSGESVKYCYWATNSGSDNALDASIEDDMGTPGTGDDVFIVLTGGSDLDGEGDAPDLANGDYVSGSLVVQHNIPLNTSITNVATLLGFGETDGEPYEVTDDASVSANQVADCTLTASVTTGACPGSATAVVLEGASVNWCAAIGWDMSAILDLTNIYVELAEDMTVNNSTSDLSPGGSITINVGSKSAGATDFNGTLVLTGSEGGLNPITCQGQATVDVVHPGLQLTKLISLDNDCSNGDESDMQTIILGESIWYCLTVENTGDVPLEDVGIDDNKITLNNFDAGDLAVDESKTFTFGPIQPPETVTNTATATATEPQTGTQLPPEMSSATVEVLAADIEVDKSVDLDAIVICDETNPSELCTEPNPGGTYDVTYTIEVSNNGPSIAFDVSVVDNLPLGFEYFGDDGGCNYSPHMLDCFIGDMNPGAVALIHVIGEIDPLEFEFPWQSVTNQACANPDPAQMDPDPSNNCDQATTDISTGPTRTIGYWGTHPHALNACMDLGPVALGFLTIESEKADNDIDATISTSSNKGVFQKPPLSAFTRNHSISKAPARAKEDSTSLMKAIVIYDEDSTAESANHMAKGLINANPANWKNKVKRSPIDQARVKAARQLTAAWCNEELFDSLFAEYLGGWDLIRMIMAGEAYFNGDGVVYCGGTCPDSALNEVIDSINYIAFVADLFNNSGDSLPIPLPSEPADPHAPEDDPTDPSD